MKASFTFLVFFLLLFFFNDLNAQPGSFGGSKVPYQMNRSPLFGKDIVIDNQPTLDQRQVAVCSAFNGWLYEVYSYNNIDVLASVRIMRSKDNGITWFKLVDAYLGNSNCIFTKLDIIAPGTDTTNLKIFLGSVWLDTISTVGGLMFPSLTGLMEVPLKMKFCISMGYVLMILHSPMIISTRQLTQILLV